MQSQKYVSSGYHSNFQKWPESRKETLSIVVIRTGFTIVGVMTHHECLDLELCKGESDECTYAGLLHTIFQKRCTVFCKISPTERFQTYPCILWYPFIDVFRWFNSQHTLGVFVMHSPYFHEELVVTKAYQLARSWYAIKIIPILCHNLSDT